MVIAPFPGFESFGFDFQHFCIILLLLKDDLTFDRTFGENHGYFSVLREKTYLIDAEEYLLGNGFKGENSEEKYGKK